MDSSAHLLSLPKEMLVKIIGEMHPTFYFAYVKGGGYRYEKFLLSVALSKLELERENYLFSTPIWPDAPEDFGKLISFISDPKINIKKSIVGNRHIEYPGQHQFLKLTRENGIGFLEFYIFSLNVNVSSFKLPLDKCDIPSLVTSLRQLEEATGEHREAGLK